MAQLFGQLIKLEGRLEKKNSGLYFLALGHQVTLLPFAAKRLPHLNFENLAATLVFKVSFSTKPSKAGSHKVNVKKLEEMEIKDISLQVPELNYTLENMNLLDPNSDFLKAMVVDSLNIEISNGRYSELLEREGTPYSEEEEKIALQIYVLTKGGDYGDMMAMVKERIENGDVLRSIESLEMKVNTYKSLDKDSGVGGLDATSSTSRKLWESYQNGEIQF